MNKKSTDGTERGSINIQKYIETFITKSKEARIVTRADNAEDEVELWKNNNYIAKNSNGSSESENDMLQRLIDKKLVYEDEIDRNNEIITIKREDGTIVKEINYSGVIINISKTPNSDLLTYTVTKGTRWKEFIIKKNPVAPSAGILFTVLDGGQIETCDGFFSEDGVPRGRNIGMWRGTAI